MMVTSTRANGRITLEKVKVAWPGRKATNTMATGDQTLCLAKADSSGQMAATTTVKCLRANATDPAN